MITRNLLSGGKETVKRLFFFAGEGRVLALVAIADKIKESSRQAIADAA